MFVGSMRQTGPRILKSGLCIGVLNEFNTWLFVICYVSKAPHAVSASEKMPGLFFLKLDPWLSLLDGVVDQAANDSIFVKKIMDDMLLLRRYAPKFSFLNNLRALKNL